MFRNIRKEVMGFANAEGGSVFVGVRKDGTVLGVANPDEVMLQIVNSLKDSLAPDVMPVCTVNTVRIEEKQVVEIQVTTGTNRPVLSSGKRTEAKWGLRQKGELYAAHDRRRNP